MEYVRGTYTEHILNFNYSLPLKIDSAITINFCDPSPWLGLGIFIHMGSN